METRSAVRFVAETREFTDRDPLSIEHLHLCPESFRVLRGPVEFQLDPVVF
jgi:hypothetical protein